MSSKRQRGEGSGSQKAQSYDKRRFVNKAASERYHSLLASKALIPKRRIKPHETQDGAVADMIIERGWSYFTQQPKAAMVTIVKEFYANAKEARHNIV